MVLVAAGQALAHHSFTAEYDSTRKTTGPNPKSWIDHAGRPHSDQLRVVETYHLLDHDNIELTLQIVDPKMYTERGWPGTISSALATSRFRYPGAALLASANEGLQQRCWR